MRLPLCTILCVVTVMCVLSCSYRHTVRVNDSAGNPIPDAFVRYDIGYFHTDQIITQANSKGEISLADVPCGYTISKEGNYPAHIYDDDVKKAVVVLYTIAEINRECSNTSQSVVEYSTSTNKILRDGITVTDYYDMRTGRGDRSYYIDSNLLWRRYGDYLVELESNGYFGSWTVETTNRYF